MSNNERSPLPTGLAEQRRNDKQRPKPDQRIRRTRSLLSNALVALMQEKPIDKITVQEVLDRATVGRSTFYLHYRGKDDLFLCVLEDGLEMWSTVLLRKQEKSYRIAPVAEFFMHVGDAKKLHRALVDSGRIHTFFELAQVYFARGIARHLKDMGLKDPVQSELDARSHALAGNMLSLLKWWLDRGARESPKAMDAMFHRMAWNGLQSKSKLP
ncbi:MAG TPA: TetR/AcrR family transcriptional regulator [Verrucomicrobiae bacterium]|jgi:AcrR family transcriptional regulator|nr:TetR/AcrR family transcriptional regulator [Verrucomicrobiae bacterium]